ncbi:26S proteasome subunit RPN7-domain-containing protein [Apiosordaria backusii]|uniref:COP9 signalosome complex subunit 1 n=1 Tax=Apiosordaria backusii TaxID=314023 RepID=A0AA40BMG1_9PEZI|nr:26S proteasome subunit RPN7-domain-containing protein [Apiosordaria backusii]
MAGPLLEFFTQMDNQGGIIVKDGPKFDLDLYIQNYRGRTKFDRLLLIGRSSVKLCVDALRAALAEAKRGRDTQRYRDVVEYLRIAAPNDPDAVYDQKWLDKQEIANHEETQRLLAELKGYKNNLIKESIRMGNEDLAKHYESIGDLNAASEYYSKMRPDVSTAKHLIDVGKHLVRVAVQRRDWNMIPAHVAKMTLGGQYPDEERNSQPFQKVATGIALLGQDKYYEAALAFLEADPSVSSKVYNEIASKNDVAVYGGLLALATMDRRELQAMVLENQNFRAFLEPEPHIRRAVTMFVNGRYAACIEILEGYRGDYLLDIYLQRHVSKIYARIRSKCVVQYLIPFSCVSLDTLEKAFGSPERPIEEELAGMIEEGVLEARIDGIESLVNTIKVDPRAQMQASALASAENYERQAIERLRRMALAAADLELVGTRKMGLHHQLGGDLAFGDQEILMG